MLLARLVLAGTGAFVLLRELGARRLPAVLGSIAWAYSLPFVLFLPWTIGNVNALLPWLVAAALRVARAPGPRTAAAFGLAMLLVHLGGHPESAFFGAAVACVFALAAAKLRLKAVGWLLAGGVAGTLAAGIEILPFLEYLSRSRALLEGGPRAHPFPASRLVTWAVPSFFGSPAHRSAWGGTSFIDHAGFAGVLFLGASGAVLLARDRRLRAAWVVLAAVVLLCYVVPPLPVFGKVRTPRLLPLAALSVVVLGSRGLGRLLAAARARRAGLAAVLAWPLLLALGVLVAVRAPYAALARTSLPGLARAAAVLALGTLLLALPRVGARVRAAGLALVVVLDAWAPSFDYHGSTRAQDMFFETGLTRFLKAQPPGWRLLPLGFTMPPETNLPQGIPSLLSYDALDDVEQARFLRRMGGYYESLFSTVDENAPRNARVLELACARFLLDEPLGRRRDTPEEARRSGLALRLAYDAPDGRIWELPSARPRAWASGPAEIDPGFRRFWPALEGRDPRTSSVPWIDAADAPPGGEGAASARLASYEPGLVRVAVAAQTPAWLVVSEGFDRGWRARVDGAPARIFRANGVFLGVPLPAGAREVVLSYRPASFVAGAALSAIGACALLSALAVRRRPAA